MHIFKKAAAALLVGGIALAGQAAPASAVGAGAVAFVGTANTSPLSSPVTPGCGGVCPAGIGSWTFSITAGAGAGVIGTTPAAGLATGSVSGTLNKVLGTAGPYCGLSAGSNGSGTLNIGGTPVPVSKVGWGASAGTLIVFFGKHNASNAHRGDLVGLVSAIPPNPVTGGGSCLDGNATNFTIVGAGAMSPTDVL